MRILIVDDHPLIREALTRVLKSIAPEAVVLEAVEPRLALDLIEREPHLDLLFLDLALPGMHGMTALQSMREKHPAISVVVVSARAHRGEREAGARPWRDGLHSEIFKQPADAECVAVGTGRRRLSTARYEVADAADRAVARAISGACAGERRPDDSRQIGLTERQAQILALMMKGESNKVICRELHVAESTVKNQITAILKTLNVTSRNRRCWKWRSWGWCSPQ